MMIISIHKKNYQQGILLFLMYLCGGNIAVAETQLDKYCYLSGEIKGQWSQRIVNKASGETSNLIIPIYVKEVAHDKIVLKAVIRGVGSLITKTVARYYFKKLPANKFYQLSSDWNIRPQKTKIFCGAGKKMNGPVVRVLNAEKDG